MSREEASGETTEDEAPAEKRTNMAEERTEMAETRTEWAHDRTDWAEHRTVLANERTFNAWLRMGLAAIAGGLAVAQFLGDGERIFAARVVGILLVILGGGVCAMAYWRYTQLSNVLEAEGLPVAPRWVAGAMVASILIGAVLVLILILFQ